jgi:hypothetical protein
MFTTFHHVSDDLPAEKEPIYRNPTFDGGLDEEDEYQ